MKQNLTQWHPAFCSAIRLELMENHRWLAALTEHLSADAANHLLEDLENLSGREENALGESILSVVMEANEMLFTQKREGFDVTCEALTRLMQPELEQAERKGRRKGKREGIRRGKQEGMILARFDDGMPLAGIAEKMSLAVEYVEEILKRNGRLRVSGGDNR